MLTKWIENSHQSFKFRNDILVEPLFEWHDQMRQAIGCYPLPVGKLLMLGFDIDVRITSFESHQEPPLALTAIFALP